MKFKYILLLLIFGFHQISISQNKVSITIDDVPNTNRFEKDGYRSVLLEKLDSLEIPIAIFINESFIYKTDSISKNLELFNNWTRKEYITLGNHSFNHSKYSAIGIDSFAYEVMNGESISRQLSKKYKKNLNYFRLPYNDLGKDSLQHLQIRNFLKEKGYVIAPHTIESSDWMYNTVYEFYLDNNDFKKAKQIGEEYLAKTLEYFDFFENLAKEDYKRPINQIYLCHDNKLNADFLPKLVAKLKMRDYEFISLKDALTDSIYSQKDNFFQDWGISWLYRWKATQEERIEVLEQEPSNETIRKHFEKTLKKLNSSE